MSLSAILRHRARSMRIPRSYQDQPLSFVRAAISSSGGAYTLRLPRQSGKNEIIAFAITEHLRRGVGDVLIFAPSYRQTRITCRRIKEHGNNRTSEGHIFHGKNGDVYTITASPTAQIVGLTASAAVIVDEAQDIDIDVFQERILPMTASTNAPVLLIGTASAKPDNLLMRYRSMLPDDRNYQLTADDIDYPPYQAHMKDILTMYGRKAPFVRTQYYQEDLDASAVLWFDPSDVIEVQRKDFPAAGRTIIGIDLGGVHDLGGDASAGNDLTEVVIAHVDLAGKVYLRQRLCWRNIQWVEQERRIRLLLKQINPYRTVIDARGVGEMLATTLAIQLGKVEAYKASRQSVSSDLYTLGSIIQRGELLAIPTIRDELIAQINNGLWETWSSAGTAAGVSVHKGQTGKIDLLKAVSYVCRAIPRQAPMHSHGIQSPI